jgi:hypothetical protein
MGSLPMPDLINAASLLPLIAFKPSWSVFIPEDGDGEEDRPSIEVKAEWLANFLGYSSSLVDDFVTVTAEDDRTPLLQLLLESLGNAADTLLVFKRRDQVVDVPESFWKNANLLLAQALERGIRTKERTVSQIARRLSAAKSHRTGKPRPVEVDEQGRVFQLSGERLFQFEPETVLEGRREIQAGKTHSLEGLREAEGRDGR